MSIKLSDLTKATKTIPVPVPDGEVSITYKTSFYTPKVEAMVASMTADNAPLAANVKILADALVSWDITDDDGKIIPITQDIIGELGMHFIIAIFTAIAEDSTPKKTN